MFINRIFLPIAFIILAGMQWGEARKLQRDVATTTSTPATKSDVSETASQNCNPQKGTHHTEDFSLVGATFGNDCSGTVFMITSGSEHFESYSNTVTNGDTTTSCTRFRYSFKDIRGVDSDGNKYTVTGQEHGFSDYSISTTTGDETDSTSRISATLNIIGQGSLANTQAKLTQICRFTPDSGFSCHPDTFKVICH